MKIFRTMIMALFMISIGVTSEGKTLSDTVTVWVDGACGMCRDRIESTAMKTRGVISAEWNHRTKELAVVHSEKLKVDRLHYALASAGHDTGELLAPEAIYNALPACCHYRTVGDHGFEDEGEDEQSNKLFGPGTSVKGTVFERTADSLVALPGANVYWSGTTKGVSADQEGRFEIPMQRGSSYLVFSFVGYGKDSVHIHEPIDLRVELSNAGNIEEVEVVYKVATTRIELDGAFDVQYLDSKELMKCACCNLSESFETNPSVDATMTDAVTGTRQIEMLGLDGQYVQINRENMPHIRGLSTVNGLGFVPGSWISGIQLNTGTGSVVNGFESITGQINVELKKPENSEALYLNLYGSRDGVMEFNANSSVSMNAKLSGGLLAHGKYQPFEFDHNGDGFMDHPSVRNGILMNRWTYSNENGLSMILGLKGVYSRKQSGQVAFDHELSPDAQGAWGAEINTDRLEAFLKVGKVFPDRPYSSLGFQVSGMYHDQEAFFGRRAYSGQQSSLYANLIYMGILGSTDHQYRAGASFQYDDYAESLAGFDFLRTEAIPGVFAEYTYNYLDRFTMVSGLRADYHNIYGVFFTPRLHLRYGVGESTVFRAMAGRGQKTANILAENLGHLASSREFIFEPGSGEENSTAMDPEVAWNAGANAAHEFTAGNRDGLVKLDYYYTWFRDQVVVNLDRRTDVVIFQQLDGRSFSHSMQAQVNYELFRNYDVRLAYRLNDVLVTIDNELMSKALTPRHRAFLNMAYETGNRWLFDMTVTWQGMKRIPGTGMNPEEHQRDEYSPNFFLWNSQVSKTFGENFDVYIGAENILNYKQDDPIIDAGNPFGDYFDASLIWGPVFGRKIYAGIRFTIK